MRSDYDLEERFVPGRLRGYRLWRLSSEGLTPIHQRMSKSWHIGQNVAECTSGAKVVPPLEDHHGTVPMLECTCGFYAKYKANELANTLGTHNPFTVVVGAIDATGKVIQGSRGFRAQFAKIVALCPIMTIDNGSYQETVRYMAGVVYGVPFYQSMYHLLKDFPEDDVSDIYKSDEEDDMASAIKRFDNAFRALMQTPVPAIPLTTNYVFEHGKIYVNGVEQPGSIIFNNGVPVPMSISGITIDPNSIINTPIINTTSTANISWIQDNLRRRMSGH